MSQEQLKPANNDMAGLLTDAIGGWRGLFDSGVPSLVFVVVYLIVSDLAPALWAAIGAGALILVWRLIRRDGYKQVIAGFVGVLICAFVVARTGRAEDFFLPGLLINIAYGSVMLLSIVVRHPLLGYVAAMFVGQGKTWRADPVKRRAANAATWVWVAVFALRLGVQLPLYLAGALGPLGVMRIVLGWPLYLAGVYFSFLLLRSRFHKEEAV